MANRICFVCSSARVSVYNFFGVHNLQLLTRQKFVALNAVLDFEYRKSRREWLRDHPKADTSTMNLQED